jgi:hypothetical protein
MLYIDFMVSTIGGGLGGGFRLSFIIDAEALIALLEWIADCIQTFIANLGTKPECAEAYPSLPTAIPEHLFLRGEIYLRGGAPKFLTNFERLANLEGFMFKLLIAIEANLPAIVTLLGWDWGDWEINFGVYLEKVPAAIANPLFGTGLRKEVKELTLGKKWQDTQIFVDLWLFKARVYEISAD